ncbi:hypothetical protein BCR42DRAFT_204204 [Absidia repens]|uniref:RING-type E3 ubiquitin transferase n=1 Tax=Absidia repens TaxID=90262 RepID=A0A1X2IR59_9FUNG|nr:hypothetical protein BCR42DRAFT_204204 [Absidia repens]
MKIMKYVGFVGASQLSKIPFITHASALAAFALYIRIVCQNGFLTAKKSKHCELCEHPFVFTPIYRQDMPAKIPAYILIKQCFYRCGTIMETGFRAIVVAIVWLVLLPYMTLWSWRFYFWSSESFGGGEFTFLQQLSSEQHQQVPLNSDSISSPLTLFDYNLQKFMADCFEGQVITLLIIVTVVAAYLFREWVVQNTPVEVEQESEIEQDDLEILGDDDEMKPFSPLARQKVAVDVLLTALGNMDDHGGSDSVIGIITATNEKRDIKCKLKDLQLDLQHELEYQRKHHQDQHFQQHQLFSDDMNTHYIAGNNCIDDSHYQPTEDDDDEAQIESMMRSIMIKDPADAFKRYSWDDLQTSSQKQQRQSPISKQGRQTPFSPLPINTIFDNTETTIIGRSSTTMTALEEECDHTILASFSREQCESPIISTRTDLYCHHHQLTENRMSTPQTTSSYEKKYDSTLTNNDNLVSSPLESSSQMQTQAPVVTESGDIHMKQTHQSPFLPHNDPRDTERMEQHDNNNNNNSIGIYDSPLEVFDMKDDEDGNDAFELGDDIDGLLEAIGMRGNPWILLQNSILVCVMVSLCLGIAIWIPLLTGRLIILVHPISLIEHVIHALRHLIDPITGGIIDRLLLAAKNRNASLPDKLECILPSFMAVLGSLTKNQYSLLLPFLSPWAHRDGVRLSASGHMLSRKNSTTTLMIQHSSANQQIILGINHWIGLLSNTMYILLENFVQRWHLFAVGKCALDRGMCIAVGYVALITLGSWYLSHHHRQCDYDRLYRTTSAGIKELLRQQGIFFKVFSFIMLELVLLPIICGILLDMATLPLIENSSISTRWDFTVAHPYCGCFLHWFAGTGFMFHFAMFVKQCREVVRPGVMWFIRDPNDPRFYPVQEIMERPLLLLLRKLCTGALIYLALIVLGMGTVTWIVGQYTSVYPLRWSFNEPLSTLAIDILAIQFLIPLLVAYTKPRDFSKQVLKIWWHTASRWLRLSSFMFGKRYPGEEGSFIRHTMMTWLPCEKPSVLVPDNSTLSSHENYCINTNVSFKMDGQLVRVPNRDGMMVHSKRNMIVPIDPVTLEPLDPMEKYFGHPTSTEVNGGSEEYNTTIVYVPPQFKLRVALFLFLMWFSGSVMTCSVTVAPLLLGRFIFATYVAPIKTVHDLYSFVLGAYVMVLLSRAFDWLARVYDYFINHRDQVGWLYLLDKAQSYLQQKMANGCKFIYLTLTIGWMIPLLVGVAVDLYVFIPIRYAKASHYTLAIHLSEDWLFGVVCIGMVYGTIYILPVNTWQKSLDRYLADGLTALNIWTLTTAHLGPWIFGALCTIFVPGGLACILIYLLDVQHAPVKMMVFRCVYPIVLCMVMMLLAVILGIKLANLWMRSIKDDTYLIGKQLHNFGGHLGNEN